MKFNKFIAVCYCFGWLLMTSIMQIYNQLTLAQWFTNASTGLLLTILFGIVGGIFYE